jgi:hypothetical protein
MPFIIISKLWHRPCVIAAINKNVKCMKTQVKQVAAWGKLSGHVHDLGDKYNPSKESMKATAMENLLTMSQESIEAVHNAEGALTNAINEREHVLEKLPLIGSRIMGALEASEAPLSHLKDVNRIRKRFRYQPSPEKEATAQNESPGGQAGQTAIGGSSPLVLGRKAQLDIASKIDNFELFIKMLENGPVYEADESDITIAGLKEFLEMLKMKQFASTEAAREFSNARLKRDELLYGTNGMHGRSKQIKGYLRSKFGLNSQAFKAARKIQFTKIRK